MNVWLINPRTERMIATELPGAVSREVGRFPPLGLLALAAYVRQHSDHRVAVLDMPAAGLSYAELAERAVRERPDFVGITGTTHNLVEVKAVAECVKAAAPRTRVCLGGPHVDAFPEESIRLAAVDFTVRGEGEEVLLALLAALAKGRTDFDGMAGLSWKRDGAPVVARQPAAPVEDLDALPFPARDLVDPRHYYYVLGKRATFTTLITSRGCPYRCIFCGTPHGRHRARTAGNVVEEMEACLAAGAAEIHFVDDTFNVRPARLAEVSREILRRRLRVRWSVRARIDGIEEEGLRLAREAGCARIHFGAETGTDEGLALLRKGITVRDVERAFALTRRLGIPTAAYFLIGCPHEKTREDVLRTIAFACRLDPDFALFNILSIYPHTELFDMAVGRGLIASDSWRTFALDPTPDFQMRFWEEHFSKAELVELLQLAYRRFYLRPVVVWRNLRALGSLGELRHKAAAAFALLRGKRAD